MFLTKTQRTSTFRVKASGFAVLFMTPILCAASWLVLESSNETTTVTPRRAGVKVIPREQATVFIPSNSNVQSAGSRIALDEDGNRIAPSSGKDLPPELTSSSSLKTKFGYQIETTSKGYQKFVPNNPIVSYSHARLDENNQITVDCFTGPESLLDVGQSPDTSNSEVTGQ